jgi:hypothetical protein
LRLTNNHDTRTAIATCTIVTHESTTTATATCVYCTITAFTGTSIAATTAIASCY